MTSMPTATLLVFLKAPIPGRVKTRLAAEIGPDEAARLYRSWISQVLEAIQPLRPGFKIVGYFDGASAADFLDWHHLADEWTRQPPGDLGHRLAVGFQRTHADGSPVLAIGTDCLAIDADLVRAAIDALNDHDAVFGPTPDGGYYLVGTCRHLPGFFDGIRWSSPHTLADHLERCREMTWSVTLLPERADIDTLADWRLSKQN